MFQTQLYEGSAIVSRVNPEVNLPAKSLYTNRKLLYDEAHYHDRTPATMDIAHLAITSVEIRSDEVYGMMPNGQLAIPGHFRQTIGT